MRAVLVMGFGLVLGACSFQDHAKKCSGDPPGCAVGEACYEGFCIPAGSGTSTSPQTMGATKPGVTSGGSGATLSAESGRGGSSPQGAGGTGKPASTSGGGSMSTMPGQPTVEPQKECANEGETMRCLVDASNKTLAEACNLGMAECKGGKWSACVGKPMAVPETCNNLDDDCNGMADDLKEDCFPPGQLGCTQTADGKWTCSGICSVGKRSCADGQATECLMAKEPKLEDCNPVQMVAQDEDCDGKTDEGCACVPGQTQTCYTGAEGTLNKGICRAGSMICDETGKAGSCMNEVKPGVETCSNLNTDDDCDGVMDNFVRALGSSCAVPLAFGPCSKGIVQCVANNPVPQCVGPAPGKELCNGQDDDCDGASDNGFDLTTDEANCGACGRVCKANESCCGSACHNLNNDEMNCGVCGMKCGAQAMCVGGKCMSMPVGGTASGGTGGGGGSTSVGGSGGGGTGASGGAGGAGGTGGAGGAAGGAGGTGGAGGVAGGMSTAGMPASL